MESPRARTHAERAACTGTLTANSHKYSGRWDLHLSGVAMQFSAVGDSAIFIHFLDSAQAWETNKPQKTYSDHNIHSF